MYFNQKLMHQEIRNVLIYGAIDINNKYIDWFLQIKRCKDVDKSTNKKVIFVFLKVYYCSQSSHWNISYIKGWTKIVKGGGVWGGGDMDMRITQFHNDEKVGSLSLQVWNG